MTEFYTNWKQRNLTKAQAMLTTCAKYPRRIDWAAFTLTEESKSNKTTTRIVIGVVTFAFTAALGYGIVHKDSTLADKVFTGAMGLLGGAGGLAVLNQKKDQEADKK